MLPVKEEVLAMFQTVLAIVWSNLQHRWIPGEVIC